MSFSTEAIARLKDKHSLSAQEYRVLLQDNDPEFCSMLRSNAQREALSVFGREIFIRGLIEISNHCRNNCLYCGIRSGNRNLERYRLSIEQILECCEKGHKLGFRTFVLQGGEDPQQDDQWVEMLVGQIRRQFPDCAITLSLGEKSRQAYECFRKAGADRYLLRHETYNAQHYCRLHPENMSRDRRLNCLFALKNLGYQTGTGIMVGSPYQTVDNIVEDLLFIQEFKPEMVGIGPFTHHPDTPFANCPDGSAELTAKLICILRLMNPKALIPASTALASTGKDARLEGILCGANVVMPNLSPASVRGKYALYEGKASRGAEAAEGLKELEKELDTIGYRINPGRGDYNYS